MTPWETKPPVDLQAHCGILPVRAGAASVTASKLSAARSSNVFLARTTYTMPSSMMKQIRPARYRYRASKSRLERRASRRFAGNMCHDPFPARIRAARSRSQGLNTSWRRPKYVFGIDGLQALHLAMKCAGAVLESANLDLEFLGQREWLVMPRFLPDLLKPGQARLEAMVKREEIKFWRTVERAHTAKTSKKSNGRRRARAADKT
jgi:hypothetical protein